MRRVRLQGHGGQRAPATVRASSRHLAKRCLTSLSSRPSSAANSAGSSRTSASSNAVRAGRGSRACNASPSGCRWILAARRSGDTCWTRTSCRRSSALIKALALGWRMPSRPARSQTPAPGCSPMAIKARCCAGGNPVRSLPWPRSSCMAASTVRNMRITRAMSACCLGNAQFARTAGANGSRGSR